MDSPDRATARTLAEHLATIPPHESVAWCAIVRAALPTLVFEEQILWQILAQRVQATQKERQASGFASFDECRILLQSVGIRLADGAAVEKIRRDL